MINRIKMPGNNCLYEPKVLLAAKGFTSVVLVIAVVWQTSYKLSGTKEMAS